MKSLKSYSFQNGNVGLLFYNQNKKSIEDVRNQLFVNLRKYHPSISAGVQKFLMERINNAPSPLLGELYPHILNELLLGINQEIFKEVSAEWMAAYVLTIMIDNSFDAGTPLNGILVAALNLEASKLQKRMVETKYSMMFEKLAFEAVCGQINDSKLQKKKGAWKAKLESAKDKNKILSAFSVVIASFVSTQKQADFVTAFSDNFLLPFQLLDDLADLNSDYLESNNTSLLSKINTSDTSLTRHALLNEVIISGTMSKAIESILIALKKGIEMIENNSQVNNGGTSYDYFTTLKDETNILGILIKEYRLPTSKVKEKMLGMIEKQIEIVCQSS